ncbi:hypothetical protein TNCV_3471711 [Trichonephila clavipes]|nr:hypothetical protein TNCV_3471711 [Trichonephila clavipes]
MHSPTGGLGSKNFLGFGEKDGLSESTVSDKMNVVLILSMERQIYLLCRCWVMSFQKASCRKNTRAYFESPGCTKTILRPCEDVGTGLRLCIVSLTTAKFP